MNRRAIRCRRPSAPALRRRTPCVAGTRRRPTSTCCSPRSGTSARRSSSRRSRTGAGSCSGWSRSCCPERAGVERELVEFVGALAGASAVSLETKQLIQAQKALLEAFIRLIAAAIDAKSPYTGGHCARVPELTKMLARAACAAKRGAVQGLRPLRGGVGGGAHRRVAARLRQGHDARVRRRQGDQARDHLPTASTRCACASRCSSATPRSRTGSGSRKAATAPACGRCSRPSGARSTPSSRSSRSATRAASSWRRSASRG